MAKSTYVDGYVLVVPRKSVAKYKKMAADGYKIWKKFGALDYKECIGDALSPEGITLTFPKLTKLKKGETVWFSYVTYKSKAHRDAVNKKVMAYMQKKYPDSAYKDMPFNMNRMSYGGFKVLVG